MLNGFEELRKRNDKFKSCSIYFDLSGAILFEDVEGMPATSDWQCRELGKKMKSIGLRHLLPASDYPVFNQEKMYDALRTKLGLSSQESESLFANRPSFLPSK